MASSTSDVAISSIKKIKTQLQGELILPQDAGYHQARKVYNAMIDKHPGMLIICPK